MIEKTHHSIFGPALIDRNFQPMTDRFLAHWLVGAQRDHDIECRRLSADLAEDTFKKHSQRTGSSPLGRHQEDLFSAVFRGWASISNQLENLISLEVEARWAA